MGREVASGMHGEGQTQGWGGRARPERTWNMRRMFVTPEVSQLEMSALMFCMLSKSWLISVMAETHQSAMGPYFASAEATSAWYAWTAAFSASLVVEVQGGDDGDEVGEGGACGGGVGSDGGAGGGGVGGGGEGDGGEGDGNCTAKKP